MAFKAYGKGEREGMCMYLQDSGDYKEQNDSPRHFVGKLIVAIDTLKKKFDTALCKKQGLRGNKTTNQGHGHSGNLLHALELYPTKDA